MSEVTGASAIAALQEEGAKLTHKMRQPIVEQTMKYILTIEADVKPDEIIGLKEQIAEVIPDARVVEVSEVG